MRGHVIAAAAFDGVIKADETAPSGDAPGHEEPAPQPPGGKRRPAGTLQDALIALIIGRGAAAHALAKRRHRPLAWGEDGASEQALHGLPPRARKDRGQAPNGTAQGERHGEHGHPCG